MRLRHKPGARDRLNQYPEVAISDPESHRGSWSDDFGGLPIHVEIGTGKGRFITQLARANPAVGLVGIEMAESVLVTALDYVIEGGLGNVKLLNHDARELSSLFSENEVTRIYLNFSDPWPKNRHAKRRLTHQDYLRLYEKVLVPGGELHFKTDNRGFFKYTISSLRHYGATIRHVNRNLHAAAPHDLIMTEYEQKFAAQGQTIYHCAASFQ